MNSNEILTEQVVDFRYYKAAPTIAGGVTMSASVRPYCSDLCFQVFISFVFFRANVDLSKVCALTFSLH